MKSKKRAASIFDSRSRKKGNAVMDSIFVLVLIFALVLILYLVSMTMGWFNTEIQADDDISQDVKDTVDDFNTRNTTMFDNAFLLVFVLLWVSVLVASFMIDSHPAFFVITVILMIFVFIIGAYLGNAYEDIVDEDSDIAAVAASYPIANWIMGHLLVVMVVMGFSIVIVLFAKNKLG